jgi:hypothetical protein
VTAQDSTKFMAREPSSCKDASTSNAFITLYSLEEDSIALFHTKDPMTNKSFQTKRHSSADPTLCDKKEKPKQSAGINAQVQSERGIYTMLMPPAPMQMQCCDERRDRIEP